MGPIYAAFVVASNHTQQSIVPTRKRLSDYAQTKAFHISKGREIFLRLLLPAKARSMLKSFKTKETPKPSDDMALKQKVMTSIISQKSRQTPPVKLEKFGNIVENVDKDVERSASSGASPKHCDAFQELNLHDIDDRFIFIEACAGCGF